jgi:Tol biopolymer transport system component
VKITPEGKVKVLDFGLAKAFHDQPTSLESPTISEMTHPGVLLGTAAYMSPEQAKGKTVDKRTDIWAFGCVLYECLTGKRAFEGETVTETLAVILKAEPDLTRLPASLRAAVARCLSKDVWKRWQAIGDVRLILEDEVAEPSALPPLTAPKPSHGWRRMALVSAAMLVLGALGGLTVSYLHQSPAVDERTIRLSLLPPEGGQFIFGNNVGGLALSPDGMTAAYIASVNGKTGLWITPLNGLSAQLLPGTEGAAYPFWSPDNKSIAYFTTGKLQRVEIRGGAPWTICDVNNGRGGAWTSDHRILFASLAAGLFEVPDRGGIPSSLTNVATSRGETSHRWPQVLPGGRFLYWVQSSKAEIQGVYAASLAKPAEGVRLVSASANAIYAPGGDGKGYLLWLRGGTLVSQELDPATLKLAGEPHPVADPVTSVGQTGQMNAGASAGGILLYSAFNTRGQFTWIDRTGKPMGVVGESGEYGAFRLSPDERRVAAAQDRPGGTDIWLLEVERGVPNLFTFNSNLCIYPVWSPDGRTIVFTPVPPRNLFRRDSGGAGAEQQLIKSPNSQYATDWSRDGRWVLYFEVAPETQRDLWVLPSTPGGDPGADANPQPYLRTPYNESWGRFSPEPSPRWVAYQSDESGRYEIYIDAFPQTRSKTRISTGGGAYPQWGTGGRELFYVSADNKLMVVDLKLAAVSAEPSTPRKLFTLPAVDTGFSPYDTTPDGQRFLVRATPEKGASQSLTVIVNWPALMKEVKR